MINRILQTFAIFAFSLCVAIFASFMFPALAMAADELTVEEFLALVFEAWKAFGGLSWAMKIATILTLLLSTMKVSFLRQLIWDKLGWAKALVAPTLALGAGVLTLSLEGNLTLAGMIAYAFAGAGALIVHELLDGIKKIPGIGSVITAIVDLLMRVLGAQKPPAPLIQGGK